MRNASMIAKRVKTSAPDPVQPVAIRTSQLGAKRRSHSDPRALRKLCKCSAAKRGNALSLTVSAASTVLLTSSARQKFTLSSIDFCGCRERAFLATGPLLCPWGATLPLPHPWPGAVSTCSTLMGRPKPANAASGPWESVPDANAGSVIAALFSMPGTLAISARQNGCRREGKNDEDGKTQLTH